MSTRAVRAIVSLVVVGAALSLVLFVTMRGSADYYEHVDEVMKDAPHWYGKNLQMHGFVVDNSVLTIPNTLQYKFKVKYNDAVVDASYTGVVPDTFKDGAEVVLTGHLTPNGFLVEPNGVTAKCPSKYVPQANAAGR